MTDKLRRTHPLNITFAEGEQPTGPKLTAVASQARVGARVLEKAVGDLWNQSGDSILNDWPLQIPNLSRQLGESKWLNPVFYPVKQSFTYRDKIGTKYTAQNEGYLQFVPASFAGLSAVAGSTALTNKVATAALVLAAGDWHVSLTTGKIKSFSAMTTADQLDYTVDPTAWAVSDAVVPGVVPDPRQADFTGCRISTDGTDYFIHLPPRMPLTLTGADLPERYPSSSEWTENQATTLGTYKLWQSAIAVALADEHYRYPIPKELDDVIGDLDEGTSLPEGFVYLWDQSTRTIVEDATFATTDQGNWVFKITTVSQDLASKVTANENESSYNDTGYSVIFVGSPISRVLWSLHKTLYNAQHDNSGDFSPVVFHSSLLGHNPPPSTYSGHGGTYPTTVPAWAPSRWAMDDHVSLLSRSGSQGTADSKHRDVNDNAMLGDLIMGSATAASGNYLNLTGATRKIYFGKVDASAPYIYGESGVLTINGILGAVGDVLNIDEDVTIFMADGMIGLYNNGQIFVDNVYVHNSSGIQPALEIHAGTHDGISVTAPTGYVLNADSTGTGGIILSFGGATLATYAAYFSTSAGATALYAQSTSTGYGAIVESDTTSPVRAAFRMVPQNAQPSGPNLIGDMYMTTAGVVKVCTVAGTPGTWVSVGAQT